MGIKISFSELIQNLGCVSSPTFPLPSVCRVEKINLNPVRITNPIFFLKRVPFVRHFWHWLNFGLVEFFLILIEAKKHINIFQTSTLQNAEVNILHAVFLARLSFKYGAKIGYSHLNTFCD